MAPGIDFYINLGLLLFQITLLVAFQVKSKVNIRAVIKIKLAFVMGVLAALFAFLLSLAGTLEGDSLPFISNNNDLMIGVQLIFYALQYFIFYLFFEGTLNVKPKSIRLAFFTSVLTLSVLGSISFSMPGPISDWIEFVWDVSYSGLGLITFIFGFYALYKAYSITREQIAIMQLVGTVFLTVGFLLGILSTNWLRSPLGLDGMPLEIVDGLKIIGVILFVVLYVINPNYILRLPVEARSILVYTQSGMHIKTINVKTKGLDKEKDEMSEDLVTALASAISTFTKEAMGSRAELDVVVTQDRIIRFKINEISLALITDTESEVLVDSLEYFSHLVINSLDPKILAGPVHIMDEKDFEIITKLVPKAFPYLIVEE